MDHDFAGLLGVLVAVVFATQVCGIAAQRIGQPAVLGELLAGILLGGSALGILDPNERVIRSLADIGVIILLFEIGLHTNLKSLMRVGGAALAVGSAGVVVPFGLGFFVAKLLGIDGPAAIICGAALTATSVGISARVLSDLGQLDTDEGRIVLGAAVFDDVIGLIILSVVGAIATGSAITFRSVAVTTGAAIGFVVVAVFIASRAIPPVFKLADRLDNAGTLGALGLAFAFLLAWLADMAGSAMIIGAFSAGLVLHTTAQRMQIEKSTTTIAHFFVPIFFAAVGAAVNLRSLSNPAALKIGSALLVVGVIGKFVAGYAPFWFKGQKSLIGIAMIPRGEVGLIFASMGLATGALDIGMFSAITLMVMGTTFIAPPLLSRYARTGAPSDTPGRGGIDDLVTGSEPGKL